MNRYFDHSGDPSSGEEVEGGQATSRINSIAPDVAPTTLVGRKSPPAQHSGRDARPLSRDLSTSHGLRSSLGLELASPAMSSTKGVKSSRNSIASTLDSVKSGQTGVVSPFTAARGVYNDTASTGNFEQATSVESSIRRSNTVRASYSPTSFSGASNIAMVSPRSAVDSLATQSTPGRAEKGIRLPSLPKFFKSRSSDVPSQQSSSDARKGGQGEELVVSPVSFFDDASTDDEEEGAEIRKAEQAVLGAPVMVKHSSTIKVDLQDMLRSTPPPEDNPGPSRLKAGQVLGEDIGSRRQSRREGVFGMPLLEQGEPETEAVNEQRHSGIWRSGFSNPFVPSGFKSHQAQDSAVAPTMRRVSFPPHPPKLEVKPEHRFLRQDIVSTPYPVSNDQDAKERSFKPGTEEAISNGATTGITLVLYNYGTLDPTVKQILIPKPQAITLVDTSEENKPPVRATMRRDFDDEKLFKTIRSEYTSMRGSLLWLAGARNVRSIRILSYNSTYQLTTRHGKRTHTGGTDGDFAEARMSKSFQKPRLGRKRHEWVEWINKLPENSVETHASDKSRIALELVEGWCVRKLAFAVLVIVLCSLIATFMWIFVGAGGTDFDARYRDGGYAGESSAGFGGREVGYRGAGARVEAGVALGLLVLMLGWTGIGAWVLLSWMVM